MKLACRRNGSRDGQLLVVSRDLRRAVVADEIALTLHRALENWEIVEPKLQQSYADLNRKASTGEFDLNSDQLEAPLPRAYQWLDASAFHSHGDLMEKAFHIDPLPGKREVPLMYQGGSDDFLGPTEDISLPSEQHGIDFEAELAVILDDVPMAIGPDAAMKHIKLIMLANDVSLRSFAPQEIKTGFGFLRAKPASSFSPVAVTPDELGSAWRDGRVHLPLHVEWNGREFGHPHAGQMAFGFHQLIAHAATTRHLRAGTILGSGTVSNCEFREVGSACIAERRAIELLDFGSPRTDYMRFGDSVRIWMAYPDGNSIFGEIHQKVVRYHHEGD
jgi:fumarylacetoacetate (FAA) hydrolase